MGSSFGRYREPAVEELSAEQQDARRALLGGSRDRVSGPFRAWLANPPLTVAVVALDEHLNSERFLLDPAEREIAILVVAAGMRAAYVVEAHRTRGLEAGLPGSAVEAILEGRPPVFTGERWALVHELSVALCRGGEVSEPLYDRAVEILGHGGLSDLALLMGYYFAVSLTINAYGVS
jgi:4-carboxymuconolactone decarboxylase